MCCGFSRTPLSEVNASLGLPPSFNKPTREKVILWKLHNAKNRFVEYKDDVKSLWTDLTKAHGFCEGFDALCQSAIIIPFEPIEAVLGSIVDVIKGLAGAILHPSLLIKNDLKPVNMTNVPVPNNTPAQGSSSSKHSSKYDSEDKQPSGIHIVCTEKISPSDLEHLPRYVFNPNDTGEESAQQSDS